MRASIRIAALVAAGLAGLAACSDKLEVTNPNDPDTKRVIASAADVESLLGNYYKRWHTAMYGALGNVWGMAAVQSFEDYSSLSNNCLGQRVGIPRAANDNSIGNICAGEQSRVYQIEAEVNRVASSILARLNGQGFTLGSPAQDERAKAFAEFLRGMSLGYLALVYDSAAIVTAETGAEEPEELSGYQDVMAAALDALQKAIDHTNASTTGGGGFPLPASWIPSSTSFTQAEFIRLIRSYRARLRANVARTPAERAAVNWDAVIADAQNGITANHDNITTPASGAGPYNTWVGQFNTFTTWHQMTPFVIGMADVSGAYAAWIAKPLNDRGNDGAFFMVTPDLRFPQGATRAAQQADFAITSCSAASTPCKRYFVNRPAGNDVTASNGWGQSNYDFVRFYSWRTSGDGTAQNGKFPFFTKAELDLLEAEGQIRKGNYAAAAALINKTRERNGLPAITAFDGTSPVPGGANCVPKVPVGPTFNTIACGNMMEAMKYEKRIETAYTHFAAWFFEMRGWGDLPQGTGLHWPVPFGDLQARGRDKSAIYSTGGGSNPASAPKGTYGW
jgi:SusD/RagB-like outer membrane lipoprotein